jgi:5-methyltetrahydropteroyltriglutamate--homocysteine methyltransferase
MITTVIGNFPKVAESGYGTQLIGAITRWQKQELSEAELTQVHQAITRAVIKEQEQAGIDVLADGQIRWEDLVTPLARGLEGFEINGLDRFFDNNVYYRRPVLQKTPVRKSPIFLGDYLFARSCTAKPVKAVLPGPCTVVTLSEDRHYKDPRPFLRSMAEILNEEARTLAQAGAPLIQFDEPAMGFLSSNHRHAKRKGALPLKAVLEAINVAASGVNAKVALSTYFGALSLEALEALQRCRVDIIGVDVVSDPKAVGTVRRVKWVKELALGCLDARNTKLETVTELHALFDVIRKVAPADRLHVTPNCGLEFLPFEQARQKLRRLVEAARRYREGT